MFELYKPTIRDLSVSLIFSFILLLPPAPAADPVPVQAIPEDQINYLRESLTEGIGTADAKLIGLCLDAFKAAGKEKNELMRIIDDAYYEAVLTAMGGWSVGGWAGRGTMRATRDTMDAWMLAARARCGDGDALDRLRTWLRDPSIETLTQTTDAAKPADPAATGRAWTIHARVRRRAEALPALAFVNPEEAEKIALLFIQKDLPALERQNTAGFMGGFYNNILATGVVRTLLVCDVTQGWAKLNKILRDEASDFPTRMELWRATAQYTKEKDKRTELLNELNRLLAEWSRINFNDNDGRHLYGLTSTLFMLKQEGALPETRELAATLEKLSAALPEHPRARVIAYINMLNNQGGMNPLGTTPMNPKKVDPPNDPKPDEIF